MQQRTLTTPCLRRLLLAACVLALLGACPRASIARTIDDERALKIKAGMVLNFVRFTEWPPEAFAKANSPIVIVLLGNDVLASHIEQVAEGQRTQGRTVRIERRAWPGPNESEDAQRTLCDELRASHVLVVFRSERDRLDLILPEVEREPVLTVSDMDGFAERGGMLGLTIRKNKVAVDANQDRIKESRVKVSSQLLRLARIVESRGV